MNQISHKINEILEELETAIIDYTLIEDGRLNITESAFRAATFVYSQVLSNKIFDLQEVEEMPLETRIDMMEACGKELRDLVKVYTNIDTMELY